jgi:hypothetical protein
MKEKRKKERKKGRKEGERKGIARKTNWNKKRKGLNYLELNVFAWFWRPIEAVKSAN